MPRNTGNQTSLKAIERAERTAKALELRKTGATFAVIAQTCGFASPSHAFQAVSKAIQDIPREAAEELRALELERLDRMLLGVWEKARSGHLGSIDRVLKIMDRRAKLLGLDLEAKQENPVVSFAEMLALARSPELHQRAQDELRAWQTEQRAMMDAIPRG